MDTGDSSLLLLMHLMPAIITRNHHKGPQGDEQELQHSSNPKPQQEIFEDRHTHPIRSNS
jgi:hypothetical protein